MRKCIYRNKKEQEKHRRNVQEHTKQVEEENCVVESQQVDLSELVNGEELENSSDVEENYETNPEANRILDGRGRIQSHEEILPVFKVWQNIYQETFC